MYILVSGVCEVIECVINLASIDHHIHVVCNTAPIDNCRLITGWIDVGVCTMESPD